jgi:hypothetical protein
MSKDRLIIFLIPPKKIVNGGVLSIFSIAKVSREYQSIHQSEVVLATYPGYKSYRKNDLFKNDETIYSFEELVARSTPAALQLHVPEYASGEVYAALQKYAGWLAKIPELSVNILAQNILMVPQPVHAAEWFSLTPTVTQTTAHDKYTTQEMANRYFLPTHHFSTFVDPRQYKWVPYEQKEKLIVLSPDVTEKREAIAKELKRALPDYEVLTIQNMTYEVYKETMSRAKFAVTFGEGFDGYYVEAFFCGGITYATYNEEFFPNEDFAGFGNTFDSYDAMLKNIVATIKRHDNKKTYEKIVHDNFKAITKLYSFENYKLNIKKFYEKKFTFLPEPGSGERLIGEVMREHDRLMAIKLKELTERDKAISGQSEMIRERDVTIHAKEQEMAGVLNSHSWKITKPLRAATGLAKKKR